jgi:1,2-diacylglycerol 3-beta-galactosyltransferase
MAGMVFVAERQRPAPGLRTVLFLFSDTGAGHRRAVEAVMQALAAEHPGQFRAVLCDPLAGPGSAWPLRWLAHLYGPAVRRAPWVWGAAWHLADSRAAMAVLGRTVFAAANRPVAAAVTAARPAAIVSCHPLTGRAAVLAARQAADRAPVITVVTDLVTVHASWRYPRADGAAVPTAAAAARYSAARSHGRPCALTGLPVDSRARSGPLTADERAALRRRLGLRDEDFVVLLAGGGEGCGGLARRAAAIQRRLGDMHVVAACGRNHRLARQLRARAASAGGDRLTVLGFVGDFADWLSCADVVVTKAGPGIIAEAACCGTPLLLSSHLPGQERGNAQLVVDAGAGRAVPGVRALVRELARLRDDPAELAALRDGCAALARPGAAGAVAALIADLARAPLPPREPAVRRDSARVR